MGFIEPFPAGPAEPWSPGFQPFPQLWQLGAGVAALAGVMLLLGPPVGWARSPGRCPGCRHVAPGLCGWQGEELGPSLSVLGHGISLRLFVPAVWQQGKE